MNWNRLGGKPSDGAQEKVSFACERPEYLTCKLLLASIQRYMAALCVLTPDSASFKAGRDHDLDGAALPVLL